MAITEAEFVLGGGGGPPPSVPLTTSAGVGDAILVWVTGLGNPASGTPNNTTVTVVDNVNAGNYVNLGFTWDATNSLWVSMHFKRVTTAGTPTISASSVAGLSFGNVDVGRYTGFVGTATADASIVASFLASVNPAVASPIVTNFANELLVLGLLAPSGGVGTGPSGGWNMAQFPTSTRNYYVVEATSGTTHNFSNSVTAAPYAMLVAGVYDLPIVGANPADGASIVSTVATGTGGQPMLPVTVGQQIDVLAFAHVVIANTCTCADQLGNTYTQIYRLNDTATNHNDFYRFRCTVTVPGTPVITATYGSTPASFNIAAAVLSGIYTANPFTSGQTAGQRQATPSGTDNQSSTATPILASQPSILAGWGFSEGETSAPVAGTGFAQLGVPVWGAPFAGVCCTYETKALSTTGPATVTFTPVDTTHPSYTFAAVFNLPPPPVTPFTKTQFFVNDTVIQQ